MAKIVAQVKLIDVYQVEVEVPDTGISLGSEVVRQAIIAEAQRHFPDHDDYEVLLVEKGIELDNRTNRV